jgi:hypothetical protein
MVLINCKKCNKSVDMPTRCFKLCTDCKIIKKTVNNKIIKTEKSISTSTFDIFNIFYLMTEISSYLTAYDVWSLYKTCKEFKSIFADEKIWAEIIQRDYLKTELSMVVNSEVIYNVNPIKYAILLETSMICPKCNVFMGKCDKICTMRYNKISKTECLNYYKLTDTEIDNIPHEVKYNNFFKKNITLFKKENILSYVCKKYNGWTNFILFRKNIEHQLELKKIKMLQNLEKKEEEFKEWKNIYNKSFNYRNMENIERQDILDLELRKQKLERREDSMLCKGFINGTVTNKCIEHIVAILKITSILFSYSHIAYTTYTDECNDYLEKLMFKNRKKKSTYTWYDSVNDTHDKFKDKLIRCNNFYTYYYFY